MFRDRQGARGGDGWMGRWVDGEMGGWVRGGESVRGVESVREAVAGVRP